MLIPKSGIFPSEQITSVKLTFGNSPTLMLALNLLNQFTRHFLKWTVCLLWLAPYVDDPSVTFIWMIFTFKIGNYSGLIMVMNGPLFFSCFLKLLIFQPLVFEGYGCLVIPTTWVGIFLPFQKFLHTLGCVGPIKILWIKSSTIICHYSEDLILFETNAHVFLLKWVYILIVLPKIEYSGHRRC